MGISFTVATGSPTSVTVIFEQNANTAGPKALDIVVSDPVYDIKRFHVPGANGNCIIRCGQEDRRIVITCRFIGTLANIKEDSEYYKALWAQNSVTITDDAGETFAGMNLVPNSFKQLRRTSCAGPLIVSGVTDEYAAFFECSYEFRQDQPGT
jgi:hypothetical protein